MFDGVGAADEETLFLDGDASKRLTGTTTLTGDSAPCARAVSIRAAAPSDASPPAASPAASVLHNPEPLACEGTPWRSSVHCEPRGATRSEAVVAAAGPSGPQTSTFDANASALKVVVLMSEVESQCSSAGGRRRKACAWWKCHSNLLMEVSRNCASVDSNLANLSTRDCREARVSFEL